MAMQKRDSDVFASLVFPDLNWYRQEWCWCPSGGRQAPARDRARPK